MVRDRVECKVRHTHVRTNTAPLGDVHGRWKVRGICSSAIVNRNVRGALGYPLMHRLLVLATVPGSTTHGSPFGRGHPRVLERGQPSCRARVHSSYHGLAKEGHLLGLNSTTSGGATNKTMKMYCTYCTVLYTLWSPQRARNESTSTCSVKVSKVAGVLVTSRVLPCIGGSPRYSLARETSELMIQQGRWIFERGSVFPC